MLSRRRFIQLGIGATTGFALVPYLQRLPAARASGLPSVDDPLYLEPVADPLELAAAVQFTNPLPVPRELGLRIDATAGGSYTAVMAPTAQDLLGGGLGLMTPVWGYGVGGSPTYPGPTFVARRGVPVSIGWVNQLGFSHLLPVDRTLHWALAGQPDEDAIAAAGVPAVAHLHGGHSESRFDGLPEQWFTQGGLTGSQYATTDYVYDNSQEAATLWYHDHALGITRLNVYAGLAGFYLLRDENELGLIEDGVIPGGDYEVELVVQDRTFYPDGRLAYPDAPLSARDSSDEPTVQPEFFGQVILVNGRAWPYLEVEPRKYRFRLLNGSDSRFYAMRLRPSRGRPASVVQIGTEDGFLAQATEIKGAIVIGPGERLDLVIDFAPYAGETLTFVNDAPTPFPDGDPVLPPADRVMQFRVTRALSPVPDASLAGSLRAAPFEVEGEPVTTRSLLLWEGSDESGRLLPLLGQTATGGQRWDDPITERPGLGDVEIWAIYNSTPDAHPIHLHLVTFEVLDRAPFRAAQNPHTGALKNVRVGVPRPARADERGPKDTVQTFPGEVTRVKARFDRPGRYVWHCHILSHEDHEMMRPYVVGSDG